MDKHFKNIMGIFLMVPWYYNIYQYKSVESADFVYISESFITNYLIKKANSRFVNVSPPSARRLSSVYLPTLGQRWLKVKKPTVFFSHVYTDMIVLDLYFSHKINIIMGKKFTGLSNIVISFLKSCYIVIQS